MTPKSLVERNRVAIETTHRLVRQVRKKLESSDRLMRRSDLTAAFGDVDMTPSVGLWESWLSGERNGTQSMLACVLDLAIEFAGADFGNIQLFDPTAEGGLRMAVSRGFDGEFLNFFALVRSSESACAVAMRQKCRVIVSDVRTDQCFNIESREIMLRAKALSVQSTPLISSSGQLFGMLSTHCRVPGTPPLASFPLLDRLARRTAKLLAPSRSWK